MSQENDRQLPDGWQWVKLGDVCDRIDYGFTASADFALTKPRFLRITDIQNGKVNWDNVPGCFINPEEEEANKLINGDIVIARTGGTTGKSFLIQKPPSAVFASYLIRLRLLESVLDKYVYTFLQSNSYWRQLKANTRGGAQPNVNAKLLASIILPLPPLSEQKRIAAILNEQMEAVEKARKATEAQLEAAKALPAAYLRAVFESEEANSWERRKLGEICHIIGGNTLPDQIISEVDERVYCLKVSDLDKSFCDNNYINSGQIYTKRSLAGNRIIPPQSIVFPKRGGAIATNKKRILTVNAVLDPNLMAVYPSGKNLSNKYLYFWFESWDLSSIQSGNSVPQINGKDIAPLEIPIPPLPKQQQIASTLTEQMQEVERLKQNLKEQLDTINKLPAVLLRRAFNGEL